MNKVRVVLAILVLLASSGVMAQQPEQPVPNPRGAVQAPVAAETAQDAGHDTQPEGEHAAEGEDHGMLASLLWPVANFAILMGLLWYFFKDSVAAHLRDRHSAIRRDLVDAANIKAAAAAQLAEIDRKLQALPGEISALRTRGAEEIAAEEQRIATQASAERERLLEQTRREIDVQVRLAKHELVEHAATLSVQLAGERIQQNITPADQDHLVDRYLEQVQGDQRAGSGR